MSGETTGRPNAGSLPEFTPADFDRFRRLLQERCGLFFDAGKLGVVRQAVQDRMQANSLTGYQPYLALLLDNAITRTLRNDPLAPPTGHRMLNREMRRLVEALAINETAFFRNREHFLALEEEILPRLIRRNRPARQLKIWSAGCSTGQEAYSLAIAAFEALRVAGEDPAGWHLRVIASDISERALRTAYFGRYRADEMRGLTPARQAAYFLPLEVPAPRDPAATSPDYSGRSRPAFVVRPEIRRLVQFQFQNLAAPAYPAEPYSNFDLALCENVTIYFPSDITRRVTSQIAVAMRDGGFLLIGYSESLWQAPDLFKLINGRHTIYYQKPFPFEDPARFRNRPITGPFLAITTARTASPPAAQPAAPAAARPLFDEPSGLEAGGPDGWPELLASARQLAARRDYERALACLERAQAVAPEDEEVLCALAEINLKLGRYRAAEAVCRRVIQRNRLSETAHLLLAAVYHRQDLIEQALLEYKNAVYINPGAVAAYLELAGIYRNAGRPRDALREYKQALHVLENRRDDELIEEVPVRLLREACRQNIARLSAPNLF